MADRRRSPRFVFVAPPDAQARAVYEAVVESWEGDRAVVTMTHATARGAEFLLRFIESSGELTTCSARVLSSTPVVRDDTVWFSLVVALTPVPSDWRMDPVPSF
jgi:hypothetical protein